MLKKSQFSRAWDNVLGVPTDDGPAKKEASLYLIIPSIFRLSEVYEGFSFSRWWERDLKEAAVDVTDLIELKQRQTKLSLQYEFS